MSDGILKLAVKCVQHSRDSRDFTLHSLTTRWGLPVVETVNSARQWDTQVTQLGRRPMVWGCWLWMICIQTQGPETWAQEKALCACSTPFFSHPGIVLHTQVSQPRTWSLETIAQQLLLSPEHPRQERWLPTLGKRSPLVLWIIW